MNHPEEAIVLLAHPDKYLLEEARRAVLIEIEPLPAVFTIEDSLSQRQIIWGDDNIFKSFRVEKGDVAGAMIYAKQALAIDVALNNKQDQAYSLYFLSKAAEKGKDAKAACDYARQSLAISQAMNTSNGDIGKGAAKGAGNVGIDAFENDCSDAL